MLLAEKFGIKDFDNPNYLRCMKSVAKKVIETYNKIASSSQYDYNSTITLNNSSDYYCDELIFTETGVYWLSEIRIYVGCNMYYDYRDQRVYQDNSEQFFLINDTASYSFNTETNEITEKDVLCQILREHKDKNNEYIIPFKKSKDKIERCCIMWSIPLSNRNPDYKDTYFVSSVIMHECGHTYDMFIQNKNTKELNKDIILLQGIYLPPYIIDNTERLKTIIDEKNRCIQIISHLNHDEIMAILKSNSELLNSSELHQYMNNVTYDIQKSHNLHKTFHRTEIIEELKSISPVFSEIYNLWQILKYVLINTGESTKEKFARIYIKDYIGNKLPDGTYPFSKNFKHSGKYDSFSFDELFSMLISRINRIFIRHCINQYSSTTGSVTEKQEIKDKRMLFELKQRRARHHRRI